jgi:MATE family multidrug resistance protein
MTALRALLGLAWPVVLARSAQAVIGFADALMTVPLGEEAVAAVTTGAMNVLAVAILPMGTVFIVQSFAAQLGAKGAHLAARRYGYYGLAFAAVTMVLALAATPLVEPLLALFSYAPGVHRAMTDYLVIRAFSFGAIVGTEALGNWYGGLGNTRIHMVAGLVAMAANVSLNWVLIYGNLGAPALGVEGAALASALASWIGFAALLVPFLRRSLPGAGERLAGLSLAEMGRMLRFGLPNGFNWFLEFAAFAVFVNVLVAGLGTTTLAAMMIVVNINSVSFMPAFGVASAGAILVGNAIGSGDRARVPALVKMTMMVTATWQGAVGLVYLTLPAELMRWFAPTATDTTGLVAVGAVLLAISAAWQLFDAAAMTLSEALRAAGDTAWTMWARIVLAWLLFVPAAFLSVAWLGGGYVAAMLCVVGYMAVLAAALVVRFRSGAWRSIDLTGLEPVLDPAPEPAR